MSESGTTEDRNGHEFVRLDSRGEVAVLTLTHPEDRNALSWAMTRALIAAVSEVRASGAGALILTSSGPVFSSGGSVDDLLDPKAPLEDMYAGFVAVAECGLPSVAAVNGPALGAGMNLALACDLIVCSPSARFETRFLGLGLHPGAGTCGSCSSGWVGRGRRRWPSSARVSAVPTRWPRDWPGPASTTARCSTRPSSSPIAPPKWTEH